MTFNEQYQRCQGVRFFPNEELVRFLGRTYGPPWPPYACVRGLRAGEIGCGTGANLCALARWGFAFTAIESSAAAIALAYAQLSEELGSTYDVSAVKLYHQAAPPLPWPSDFFDLIVDVQTLQHFSLEQQRATYKEIYRTLKPGGCFFQVHYLNGDAQTVYPAHPELQHLYSGKLWELWEEGGLFVNSLETLERTHQNRSYTTTYAITEGIKPL